MWQIVVLSLVILSALASTSAFCSTLHQLQDHGCCAPFKVAASSCCQPDTARQSAIPTQLSDTTCCVIARSFATIDTVNLEPLILLSQRSNLPPAMLPATVLRT